MSSETIQKGFKLYSHSFLLSILIVTITLVISIILSKYLQKVYADINQTINFQGKLTNVDGTNFTGICATSCDFEFSIYDSSSGGSLLWAETQNAVKLTDGIFNVKLGSSTAFSGYLDPVHLDNFNKSPLYLQIKVDADNNGVFDANETFNTRLLLSSVPYAFNSSFLGGLDKNGFLQLAPASAQLDSTTSSAIFINKTGANGNLLQLQQAGNDKFVVGNDGTTTISGGLIFTNASPTIQINNASTLTYTDGVNNLLFAKDLSTNFGMALDAGAFIDRNSYVGEEFSKERADVNADGALNWGDTLALGTDESNNCIFSIVDDVINGIGRISTNAGGGQSCLAYHSSTATGNGHLIFNSTNLPVMLMKVRPSTSGVNAHSWVGISDAVAGSTTEPNNGIYFSNNNSATWYGVTRNADTSTYINCNTEISPTQFALLKIEVISTSEVRFYADASTTDGINWTYCGASSSNIPTNNLTSLMMRSATSNNSYLDVDFYRVWQDDSNFVANTGLDVSIASSEGEENQTEMTAEEKEIAVIKSEIDERFNNLEEKINSLSVDPYDSNSGSLPSDNYSALLSLVTIGSSKLNINFNLDVVGDLIATGGLVVREDAEFAGQVIFNKDTVGQVRILAGATEASVKFEKEYRYQPIVNLSIEGESDIHKYYADNVTTEGFRVKIEPAQEKDATLNWHAFGSKDGYVTLSDDTKMQVKVIRVLKGMDQVFTDPLSSPECLSYVYERGFSSEHNGVDLAREQGCPINSIGTGLVYFVGWEDISGYTVKIDHGNDVKSYYYHGSDVFYVEVGDYVTPGQKIMEMGTSGNSTGTHLHLGLAVNGEFIDPSNYVPYQTSGAHLQAETSDDLTTSTRGTGINNDAHPLNENTLVGESPKKDNSANSNRADSLGTLTVLPTELGYLRIRELSNSDSNELGQIPVGVTTQYYEEAFGWYRIKYKGVDGWVSGLYVLVNN